MKETQRPARRRIGPVSIWLLLVLLLSACSSARGDTRNINLGRSYTLKSGEQRDGDQVVWANDIVYEAGTRVEGDVTLVGESVSFDSQVTGDVIIVADRLEIGPESQVSGDVTACATDLVRSESAVIGGEFKEECDSSTRVSFANLVQTGWENWRRSWFFRLSSLVFGSLFFGALAALGTILFPRALTCMSRSIRQAPVVTGGVGLLTMLLAVGLTLLYALSLLLVLPVVLLPFVLIGWLVIVLFSALGWVALAEPFGLWVLARLGMSDLPRMAGAAVGGVILALLLRVWSLFWFTAWIGLLSSAIVLAIGLGAVVLTRVGTKPYPHPNDESPAGAVVARLAE